MLVSLSDDLAILVDLLIADALPHAGAAIIPFIALICQFASRDLRHLGDGFHGDISLCDVFELLTRKTNVANTEAGNATVGIRGAAP